MSDRLGLAYVLIHVLLLAETQGTCQLAEEIVTGLVVPQALSGSWPTHWNRLQAWSFGWLVRIPSRQELPCALRGIGFHPPPSQLGINISKDLELELSPLFLKQGWMKY